MKYEEFKELILKIDIKDIELDEVVKKTFVKNKFPEPIVINNELTELVNHLRILAESFETRVDFELSKHYILKRKEKKLSEQENSDLEKNLKKGTITLEEYKKCQKD